MKFTSYLLNVSFFFLSFGQLARIAWPDQPIFFYLFEPIVAAVTIMLVINTRKSWRDSLLAKSALIFLGTTLLSLLASLSSYTAAENMVAVLYFARMSMYIVFIVSLLEYSKRTKLNTWGKFGLGSTAFFIIFSSIVQYVWYPNLGNLAYLGWDPHLYRVVGLFFDPPLTISVFVLLMLYYLTVHVKKRWLLTLIYIIPLIILSLLTYSRGGYVGIAAVIGTYVLIQRKFKLYLVAAIMVVLAFILIPKGQLESINLFRTASISARIEDYDKAVRIWKGNPILGIGYNHIRAEKDQYEKDTYYGPFNPSHGSASFHSSFLIILVTGGVVGLVSWGVFLYFLARTSPFMMYAVIFLCVISLFDNVLLHPIPLFLVGYLGSNRAPRK
ncbi:O-antigen ligase family protein [Candidatus Woesebacteria bacterium]|nr:O-antigen ligase family protein [Candidatus Woesebacteria bacterium]